MSPRFSRSLTFLLIVALAAPLFMAPTAAAPTAQARMGEVQTASDGPAVKIHPGLRAAVAAAAPGESLAVLVHAQAGVDLSGYLADDLVRPYVLPNGTQAHYGTIRAGLVDKLASLPKVAMVQEMRSLIDVPRLPEAPERAAAGAAAPVRTADWFDVLDVHQSKAAWDLGYTGAGVKVMVNDSGIDFAHPDLQGTQARDMDPQSPYYGWPVAFDSASMLALAYDYILGTHYIATGTGPLGVAPDYADTSTKRQGADLTTNADGTLAASFKPLAATAAHTYVFSPTSKSGVYHFGSHPDVALMKLGPKLKERWAVLVTDEKAAGVYDTVYVDLNGDFKFTDEKPARKGSEEIYRDLNGDGYPDRSGGSIYWISDGVNPLPVSDWLWGIGADMAGPGDLVAFTIMDYSEGGGNHGQYCASGVAAQGVIDGNAPAIKPAGDGTPGTGMVRGGGKDAKLAAAGNFYVTPSNEEPFLFAALGYDGIPGTDDDVQIISNSWGYSGTDNDGWDYLSRMVDVIERYVNPNLSNTNSMGNGAAGYGTSNSPGESLGIGVAASTLYDTDGVFDSITALDQVEYNDIMSWSGRGPSAMGETATSIAANGAWGAGDLPLNEAGNGWTAWASWGGTSRSAPVAAGNLALVYQAFRAKNGRWPTNAEARAILMAGADKAYNDGFTEGAGTLNALRSVKIAAGLDGVYALPDNWTFGDYRGKSYDAFAKIMFPGQSATKEFTVHNSAAAAKTLTLRDEWPIKTGAKQWEVTSANVAQESAYSGNKPDYLWDITNLIPAGTDLVEVKVAFPFGEFDPDGNYSQNQEWRAVVYDWTDVNGDGNFWSDLNSNGVVNCPLRSGAPNYADPACELQRGEYMRFSYGYDAGTSVQARVKQPLARMHNGVFVGLLHRTRSNALPVTHLKIQLNFYKMLDIPWLTTDQTVTVPAGGTATFKATLSLPGLAPFGLYSGFIRLSDGQAESSIPVVANVASWSTDFVFGGPQPLETMYNNGEMYGYFYWGWRAESGDWRFYFVDVPDSAGAGTSLLVDTRWSGWWSDIDTIIMGPQDDCFSNGVGCTFPFSTFPGAPSVYGPYSLGLKGGSARNYLGSGKWRWDTSTGYQREIVAATTKPGLNVIALQNVLFDGGQVAEPFVGQVGSIKATPAAVDMFVGAKTGGSFPAQVQSSLALAGLSVEAFGLGVPDVQQGLEQKQDNPSDPATSSYKFPITVQHGARLEVSTTAAAGDLDLFLLYDFNGNGQFEYPAERIGSSTTSSSNEFIRVKLPRDGAYQAWVHGYQAAAAPFDFTVNAVQGNDMTVTGLPAGPFQPNQPINFTVNWTKTIPAGQAAEGLILAGPPGAPAALQIPVRLHNIVTKTVTDKLAPAGDAYLAYGQPTTNFNSGFNRGSLFVGANVANADQLRSVLKFDLSALAGYPVQSARLYVYVDSRTGAPDAHELRAYEVTKPWAEGTVTWNAPWATPGGDYVEPAAAATPLSPAGVGHWVTLDVTALAQKWAADAAANNGVILRARNTPNYSIYHLFSKDYWNPAMRPYLEVTYGAP
jgi:hypothetical protein